MYRFFRPLLFRLDPEFSHQLTLQLLRLGSGEPVHSILRLLYATHSKPVQAFGLAFRNPVGLAAGYDKNAVAVQGLTALGFGHIEVGTVTPQPQAGNPRPRVFRLPEDEAVINRMGFPGRGSEYVIGKLRRAGPVGYWKSDAVVGVNLGRNRDTPNEEAVLDYLELLQGFAPYADYVTINISSPNTIGLRQLQGAGALTALLEQVHAQRKLEEAALEKRLPILVKLAPDLSIAELDEAVDVILQARMDGIVVTNTTTGREGVRSTRGGETGGLSGSPLRVRSEAVLHQVVQRVSGKVPIISAGGIMTAEDAKCRLELGAALVQIYTGLIYRGPGLVREIVRGL